MAYYVGDTPAEQIVIEPPETTDLTAFTGVEATLYAPDGTTEILPATIDAAAGVILVDPPAVYALPGVYRLRVALTGVGVRQSFPDLRVIVQDPDDGWHTLDSIRAEWPDAEFIADPLLWKVLEVSKLECLAYAPALVVDAPIPLNYLDAQGVQARNRWNARKVAPDGTTGEGDFVIRPFPLDWHVKAILRPKQGLPVIA